MARRIAYHVIKYGAWTPPRLRNFREQCCDCGLIHRLDFRIVDGRIEFRTRRDDRATAAAAQAVIPERQEILLSGWSISRRLSSEDLRTSIVEQPASF